MKILYKKKSFFIHERLGFFGRIVITVYFQRVFFLIYHRTLNIDILLTYISTHHHCIKEAPIFRRWLPIPSFLWRSRTRQYALGGN